MKKHINLYAYFACNLGDDLMVDILTKRFPKYSFYTERDVKNPWLLKNRNFKSKACYDQQGKNKIPENKSDLLCSVLIGGSVFMQRGALTEEQVRARMAWNNRYLNYGPLFVIGANFGEYFTESFKNSFDEYFHKCKGVSFRDKASYDQFSHVPAVQYAPDVVFGLKKIPRGRKNTNKIIISVIDLTRKYGLEQYSGKYESFIANYCKYVISLGKIPFLMSFCRSEGDEEAIKRILTLMGSAAENVQTYFYRGNMKEALKKIADAEFVLASRFHAMVLALRFNKPFFALSYDIKITNVLKDMGCDLYWDIKQIDSITPSAIPIQKTPLPDIKKYMAESKRHFDQLENYLLFK